MKKVLGAFILSLAILCGGNAAQALEPIYNVQNHPVPTAAQKLPLDDIGRAIIVAGALRHWRFEMLGPGQMKGTNTDGKHDAIVNILFTQTSYSITYNNSVNFPREGNEIHRKYNSWVHNLERDIEDRLIIAGVEAK